MIGGRYEVLRELGGRPEMRVFDAMDTVTGMPVTVKTFHTDDADDVEGLLRFQQEGTVRSTLKHPNICEVYRTFTEEGTSCIILERLEGRTLAEVLRTETLDLRRAKSISLQVASGLEYSHQHQIIHRDINPNNIMVLSGDQVKIRAMEELGAARILSFGAGISTLEFTSGTPHYLAPEQFTGPTLDGRADIYSLSAIMYQMVTGRPPFEGSNVLAIASKHIREQPRPPKALKPELPPQWQFVILRGLAKNPGDRFQTALEMEEALMALPPIDRDMSGTGASQANGQQARICPTCGRLSRGRFCGGCGTELISG